MITIELNKQEANILSEMLYTAVLDMSDYATYSELDRAKMLRDKIYSQLIVAGGLGDERFVPKF